MTYTIATYQAEDGKWHASGSLIDADGKLSEFDFPPEDAFDSKEEAEESAKKTFEEMGYTEKKG